jgi:two-component system, sensor histidine kinase and response regulator
MLKKFWSNISYVGISPQSLSFNSQRLVIFNQLIFLSIAAAVVRLAVISIANIREFSLVAYTVNILPVITCLLITWLNNTKRFNTSQFIAFFILPPVFLLISLSQHDYSLSSLYAVFGVLSFFFISKQTVVFLAYALSSACFMTIKLVEFYAPGRDALFSELLLMMFNQLLVVVLFCLLLNFIRRVIFSYQFKLNSRTNQLTHKNRTLEEQQGRILEKEALLEEKQLSLLSATRQNNKMVSIISHDLRTPVVSVKNIFDLYAKDILTGEQLLAYMPEINREMGGVIDLLENLLNWTKQHSAGTAQKPEYINIHELVNEIMSFYKLTAASKNITLVNGTNPQHTMFTDRQMIKVVVRNLVSNAIKFTGIQGQVRFTSLQNSTSATLSIADNGTGMQAGLVEKIMTGEVFTTKGTANEIGSGLGLSLCREFIGRSRGNMHVESEPGVGTRFNITLPAATGSSVKVVHIDTAACNNCLPVIPPQDVLRPAKRM